MLQQGLPNTPMEDVTMQRNLIHSEMIHSDTVVRKKKGRNRKRKRKWKRRTAPAKVDLIQQPTDGTCLVTDPRLVERDVKFGDCGDIQQTSFNKSSLSNDINISRDGHSIVDNKNTVEVNVKQLPGANVNPVSMVVEHTEQVCTNNASQEVGLGAPLAKEKKKRKKGRKNLNALTSNDLHYDSLVAPSIHNSSLENESIQQATTSTSLVADSEVMLHCAEIGLPVESLKEMHPSVYESNGNISCVEGRHVATDLTSIQEANTNSISKVVESDHQACTGNISISQGLNLGVLRTKRKKRKGRGKNQISLTNNGELHDNLTCLSLARENPLYNDSIQQPVVDICIMTDSEVVQQGAKLGQCDDTQKGIHYNSAESNDSDKGSRDIHMKMNAKSTPESNANPIHKVTKDDDPTCADNVSEKMGMAPLQPKKTKRKKKKKNPNALTKVIMPSACLMTDSELMQHNAEQGIPKDIHQNACATKDKSCSGKDSPGIIDNQNNSEVNTNSFSQGKGLVNMQGNKKRKRKSPWKNLNPESKEGVISSIDLSGEQQVKRDKLNADQNAGIGRTLTGGIKKKLLVIDLNGLLADIVGDKIRDFKPDGIVAGKKIFKRPFCEDFLQFCFERFTVGVWSSRKKKNVDMVIKVTMGGKNRSKLAFIWNQFQCTRTGFQTIENTEKPLFLKKLSQLWNNKNGRLPWKVGDYDESNTLLLDDSPYKALQNPPYTAIFPNPYQYQDQNDNALGPGGVLRVYLEGLALAEDVQEYVKQNPFGQKPITESDPNWSFYAKVISSGSKGQLKGTSQRDKQINTQINSNPSLKIRVAPPQNQNTVEDSSTKDMPSNFLNLLRMHQLRMQSRTI